MLSSSLDTLNVSLEERRKVAESLQEVIRNWEGRANSQSNTSNSTSADNQKSFSEIAEEVFYSSSEPVKSSRKKKKAGPPPRSYAEVTTNDDA